MGKDRKARFKRQVMPVGAMEKCIITFFTMGLLRTALKREMEEIIAFQKF
jgi:hypothetical protein